MQQDDGAPKLQNLDAFMQILGDRFEDHTAAWHAEICICSMRQGKQMVAEYIQNFHSLEAHLRDWLKCMLAYLLVFCSGRPKQKAVSHLCALGGAP